MELPPTQSTAPPPPTPRSRSSLRNKLAIVGATGVLFTGAVFGLSSLAAAQDPENPDRPAAEVDDGSADADATADAGAGVAVEVDVHGDEDGLRYDVEITPEDEALLERFEQCLTDGGLETFEEDGDSFIEDEDWERIDRVFEDCEPILDELSDGAGRLFHDDFELDELEGFELSDEDKAVFEEFEQCLADRGSEDCESILDELSEDADFFIGGFEDCEDLEDEHDFEDDPEPGFQEGHESESEPDADPQA